MRKLIVVLGLYLIVNPAVLPQEAASRSPNSPPALEVPKSLTVPHRVPERARSDEQAKLIALSKNADIIVIVEVDQIWDSPGRWSGYLASIQNVDYKVIKTIKGALDSDKITVGFIIDSESPFVDPETPRLSEKLFSLGKEHVIFIKVDSERRYGSPTSLRYFAPNDHSGIVLATKETVDSLQRTLSENKD